MQISIKSVSELPPQPDTALGFGPEGWVVGNFEPVVIESNGMSIRQVMQYVEIQHGGILGDGELLFYLLSEAPSKGYIVFQPSEFSRSRRTLGRRMGLGRRVVRVSTLRRNHGKT